MVIVCLIIWKVWATEVVGMANPASVKCTVDGWVLTLKSDAQGSQYGECRFPSGKICEERAYFRGECNQDILDTTERTLTTYDKKPMSGTLSFASGMMYSRLCNTIAQPYFSSSYTISSTGNGISTLMACDWLLSEVEDNFDFTVPAFFSLSGTILTISTSSSHIYVFRKTPFTHKKDTPVVIWWSDSELQKAITRAYEHKITVFSTLESFGGARSISRQEAAKMISVFLTTILNKKVSGTCPTYKDDKSISSWLKNSVYTACKLWIMNGYRWLFNPYWSLLKSHTLSLLMRARIGKQDESLQPRRQSYADKAIEAWYLVSSDFDEMNTAITRWELVQWMYKMR